MTIRSYRAHDEAAVIDLWQRRVGCAKINLQVRSGNAQAIEFYKRIGFGIDEVVSMGKRLERDDG